MAENKEAAAEKTATVTAEKNTLKVETEGKKDKTEIGKILSAAYSFIKQFVEIQIKAVPVGRGFKIELYLLHRFNMPAKITKGPVTQTEAAKIIEDIKKGDLIALRQNPNVKTGKAIRAVRIYQENNLENKTA